MTITREPHAESMVCIPCGVPATVRGLDHSHIIPRSQAPDRVDDPTNTVLQCRREHDLIGAKKARQGIETFEIGESKVMFYVYERWSDEKADFEEVTRVRVVVDKKRGHLVPQDGEETRPVSATAEGEVKPAKATATRLPTGSHGADTGGSSEPVRGPSAAAPSVKEEDDGELLIRGADRHGDSGSAKHPHSSLTHEQRVAIAQQIKDTEWNRQWFAGDTGNAWIAELGEEAEQYLSDFGYIQESLANILRVCAAIPPPYRNGNLRYSHHVVVYQLSREDQVLRLKECEDEGWSVAEFRRQVHGEAKPKIKRWALSELLEAVEAWPHPTDRPRPKGAVRAYLEWLREQA